MEKLRAKALLGLPLTKRERARFLLLVGTKKEIEYFLMKEKGGLRLL